MTIRNFKYTLFSLAIGAMCGLPVSADDSNQNDSRRQDRQGQRQSQADWGSGGDSDRPSDQNSDRAAKNSKSKSSQQAKSTKSNSKDSQSGAHNGQQSHDDHAHVVPVGWVNIAVDYNNDGWYDGWETIYYYDYQQARESSRQRSQNGSQQSANEGPRRARIQGEIVQMKTEKSSDGNNKRVVAQIKNSQGRKAEVCLGPQDKLSKLNLSNGDQVSVEGVLMRKDGQLKLLASRVASNGQSVTHKLTKRPMLNRVKGELTRLSEAKSKRGDGIFLIGKIKTDNGSKTVHFGPKKQLSKLNLSEGDDVNVITRTGSVSGKKATLALQVSANDETVKIARQPKQKDNNHQSNRKRDNS